MALQETYRPTPRKQRAVYYPTSDGKPMAETDKHRDQMIDDILGLKLRYERTPNVYVSGNNFIYYEEDKPKACIPPDTYVVFGVGSQPRDLYKVWEEGGRMPNVVFEFTSRKTRTEDQKIKLPLYKNRLKVPEIFYFDPTGDYLKPHRLRGYRRVGESYVELELVEERLHSEQLGLDLVAEGEKLRLYDPAKGQFVLTPLEHAHRADAEEERADAAVERAEEAVERAQQEAQARRQAEERAQQEKQARQQAEERARVAEERAREEALARQLAEARTQEETQARRQAQERAQEEAQARQRAEQQARQADQRTEEVEAELRRLRERLQALEPELGEGE